jgi:hypothetical protein
MLTRTCVLVMGLLVIAPVPAVSAEKDDVLKVVMDSYVTAVHVTRDAAAMRRGFHPDFRMLVLGADGTMSAVTRDEWAGRLEKAAADPNAPKLPALKHAFSHVDIQGSAAVVRVELWKNDVLTFTDYLSLYKVPDGWKIVGKIYFTHPKA